MVSSQISDGQVGPNDSDVRNSSIPSTWTRLQVPKMGHDPMKTGTTESPFSEVRTETPSTVYFIYANHDMGGRRVFTHLDVCQGRRPGRPVPAGDPRAGSNPIAGSGGGDKARQRRRRTSAFEEDANHAVL